MTTLESSLNGVRVADFSGTLPGPLTTLALWQLGAEVVKIERPVGGDPVRGYGMFDLLNAGKRCVALDLGAEAGREAAELIVAQADVVVEGFRPGTLSRFGLGYEQLKVSNPGLVYCSLSGFGQAGPRRLEPGHDLTYGALAGLSWLSRDIDGRQVCAAPSVRGGDLLGALLAVIGILAALRDRDHTQQGRLIDVSLHDASMLAALVDIAEILVPKGQGSSPRSSPIFTVEADTPSYRLFETSDRQHVALAITSYEDSFWKRFCQAVGRQDLAELGAAARREQAGHVAGELEQLFGSRTRQQWAVLLDGVDIPWSPVLRPEEAIADEHAAQRGVYADGRLRVPVGAGVRSGRGAPGLGEDTEAVLTELGAAPSLVEAVLGANAPQAGRDV